MKVFGFGLITGLVVGAVGSFLKMPTGETVRDNLKQKVVDTQIDIQNINNAKQQLNDNLTYLQNDGKALITDFSDYVTDRLDGFQMEVQPKLSRIEQISQDLQQKLPNEEKENN